MKRIVPLTAILLLGVWSLTAATEETGRESLTSDAKKLSYAAGIEVGTSLKQIDEKIDLDVFFQGVQDRFEGKELLLTPEEAAAVKEAFLQKQQEERERTAQELVEKNRKEEEAFLAENKNQDGVITTASGLQYMVLREGDGPKPTVDDIVKTHYRGTLINGTEFDNSYARGDPLVIRVNQVIPGWTEALQLMPVGSKYRLVIPSRLAYGERGAGQLIGPNATLVFEVELLSIEE